MAAAHLGIPGRGEESAARSDERVHVRIELIIPEDGPFRRLQEFAENALNRGRYHVGAEAQQRVQCSTLKDGTFDTPSPQVTRLRFKVEDEVGKDMRQNVIRPI